MAADKNVIMFVIMATAMGFLGVTGLEITVVSQEQQQADAIGCPIGGPGFNASKGRCIH